MENGDSKIHHGLCLIRALPPHRCNQFFGSKCPCKPGDHEQKNSPVRSLRETLHAGLAAIMK